MKRSLILMGAIWGLAGGAFAVVPEPDNVVYGAIAFGGLQVTAAETNVTIQASLALNGPPISTYQMGANPVLGNLYSLRIATESLAPAASQSAVLSNQLVFITVSDGTGVRAQATYTVGARGQIARMDLSGATSGQTAFPADNSPTDNAVSINEAVAYLLAWRTGAPWPIGPTNVPLNYAVRAGSLWRGGGGYILDSTIGSAPAWWVNTNGASANLSTAGDGAVCTMPATYTPGVPFTVTDTITPSSGVGVYAVEDQVPAGWQVINISSNGVFDPVNQKVKWGLFFDQTARVLTYQVVAPLGSTFGGSFAGQASFDGTATISISGQRAIAYISPMVALPQTLGFGSGIHLKINGNPGQSVTLQISSDLVNWRAVETVVIDSSGAQDWVEPIGTNQQLFYRAHLER
jgi:hypothetical protein